MNRYLNHLLYATITAAAIALSVAGATEDASAQQVVRIQDSLWAHYVIGNDSVGRDTLDPDGYAPAYDFELQSDSCFTDYKWTEARLNGKNLYMPGWHLDDEVTTLDAADLALITVTENFGVETGDTISCYRELQWYDTNGFQQLADNYYSLDTLDFVIELADATDSSRIALLDSFGVNRRDTRGSPVFHGTGPIMRTITYTVPPSIDGDSVFMRSRIYQRGNGGYYPVRLATVTYWLSQRLTNAHWEYYRSTFNGGFTKRNTRELKEGTQDPRITLTAVPNPTSGTVDIGFERSRADGFVQLIVYSTDGSPVFVAAAGPKLQRIDGVRYTFPTSGVYFIVVQVDGVVVKSLPITVAR